MKIIPRSFYARDTVEVAQDLIGKILVRKINGLIVSGMIVETEAYRYKDDEASHSYGGKTPRNQIMFGEVGRAYVYFTYGMHYCVNAVARSAEYDAGAVLIRSIAPLNGIDIMIKQRKTSVLSNLTNGPAKLTQALQITKQLYGEDLTRNSTLCISEGQKVRRSEIVARPRIGIKKATDKLWNFKLVKNIAKEN